MHFICVLDFKRFQKICKSCVLFQYSSAPQLGVASNRERQAQEEEDDEDSNDADDEVEEEISWEVDQTPCLLDEDQIVGPVTYGFAGRRSGVFSRLQVIFSVQMVWRVSAFQLQSTDFLTFSSITFCDR